MSDYTADREKPMNGDHYSWDSFVKYADEVGIGTHEDDWSSDWELWKTAYKTALGGN